MNAEILCVGTELLLGDIVNTNATFIARGLAAMGINLFYQSVAGDNPERLKRALNIAKDRADLIILTGGLGPTYDDLTKETVAELVGKTLVMDQPTMESIEAYFKKVNRPMTESNKKQAMIPEGATVFENHWGTAPGFGVEADGKIFILLPGPPREMEPMFQASVVPYLARFNDHVFVSQNIHIFGMGESAVEETLRDLMIGLTNPTLAPYAKDGEVNLRVTASAPTEQEARAMIGPVIEQVKERIGDVVYTTEEDSLQAALVKALAAQGLTLATAESCTGGLLSSRIVEVSGCSSVFHCGVCAYSNDMKEQLLGVRHKTLKQFGAVSEQTALEMARGVRKLGGADIGLSTTGIAGPEGGTDKKPVGLVYVGISSPWMEKTIQLNLSRGQWDERNLIRYLAASNALNLALQAVKAKPGTIT